MPRTGAGTRGLWKGGCARCVVLSGSQGAPLVVSRKARRETPRHRGENDLNNHLQSDSPEARKQATSSARSASASGRWGASEGCNFRREVGALLLPLNGLQSTCRDVPSIARVRGRLIGIGKRHEVPATAVSGTTRPNTSPVRMSKDAQRACPATTVLELVADDAPVTHVRLGGCVLVETADRDPHPLNP